MTEQQPLAVEVRRGAPSDDELAAVIAVVTEAYAEEAATAVAPEGPVRSRWRLAARGPRHPLSRERGWTGSAW